MNFYLIGVDYKKTPIRTREDIYWDRLELEAFIDAYAPSRTAMLYTCNRFEIYGITDDAFGAHNFAGALKSHFTEYFKDSYTVYGEENVLNHLALLASGLKSQIRGEFEISSQLNAWADNEDTPKDLSRLVRDALSIAREIRAREGLNRPENNIAALLYGRILKEAHSDDLLNIVVIGTGKVSSLLASYKPEGVRIYFVSHKNIERAEALAKRAGGSAADFKELPELLFKADVLISATSSPHRIFDKNYFLKVAASRKKELCIYDLAVPRDVAPEAKEINGIVLNNIDEVILNENSDSRYKAERLSR